MYSDAAMSAIPYYFNLDLARLAVEAGTHFCDLGGNTEIVFQQKELDSLARERGIPYLGICLGMHVAVSEYARHVLGLEGANSTEMDPETPHPVIDLLPEQKEIEDLGGTMRLGNYDCVIEKGSLAEKVYGSTKIIERHRHRYECNNAYRDQYESWGIKATGTSPDGNLVEMIEAIDHPYFIATQAHPEFKSRPNHPHPLFAGFIQAIK